MRDFHLEQFARGFSEQLNETLKDSDLRINTVIHTDNEFPMIVCKFVDKENASILPTKRDDKKEYDDFIKKINFTELSFEDMKIFMTYETKVFGILLNGCFFNQLLKFDFNTLLD